MTQHWLRPLADWHAGEELDYCTQVTGRLLQFHREMTASFEAVTADWWEENVWTNKVSDPLKIHTRQLRLVAPFQGRRLMGFLESSRNFRTV